MPYRGSPNRDEATDADFFGLAALPTPIHAPTGHALDLLASYRQSGNFQVR